MDKKRVLFAILIIISFFGIFLSSMLTVAKYSEKVALLCGENIDNSCNKVQESEFSNIINLKDENNNTIFEIPLSLLGIIFYILTLCLSFVMFLGYRKNKLIKIKYKYILLFFCLIGFISSIIFVLVQAFLIEAFCTYCMISAFDTLILFTISLYLFFI